MKRSIRFFLYLCGIAVSAAMGLASVANAGTLHFNDEVPTDVRAFILEVANQHGCSEANQVQINGPMRTEIAGENLWVITTGPNCISMGARDPYLHQTAFIYDDYNQIIWWGHGGTEAVAQSAKSHFDDNGNRRMLRYEDIMDLRDKYNIRN